MKRISIGLLLTFVLLIIFSACKEDKWLDWKNLNDEWYAKHKNDDGFHTTSSGLAYQIIYAGAPTLRKPDANSVVVVNYKGSLIDGSVFDTALNDSTATLYLPNTVSGWQEGLKMVHNGAHIKLYIPSELGYGTSTSNSLIPPHSVLIFDIYLRDSYYYPKSN